MTSASSAQLPMEDDASDILAKASHGLGLDVPQIAGRAGLSTEEVTRALRWEGNQIARDAVASVLGLKASRLDDLVSGAACPPLVALPSGMERVTSEWGGMTVHAYLLWDPVTREAAAFDTGADASGIIALLKDHNLSLKHLFLTHGHGDHLFDMERLVGGRGTGIVVGRGELEGEIPGLREIDPGEQFTMGHLRISTIAGDGHSPGGIVFVIEGLASPVAVVGDALFAGSMGGPKVSYPASLASVRRILSLDPGTILASGHGPLTTVAWELSHNTFFTSVA